MSAVVGGWGNVDAACLTTDYLGGDRRRAAPAGIFLAMGVGCLLRRLPAGRGGAASTTALWAPDALGPFRRPAREGWQRPKKHAS